MGRDASQLVESLDAARQAAERHAWRNAYDAYTSAPQRELTPADLERFADAAWWTGRRDEAISLRQRAYSGFAAAGEKVGAARVAAAGLGEILVSRETLDGIGAAFRLSEPRAEALKGFEQPIDVVSVDWR